MAVYYRWFIPASAELTSPLIDLTRKGASDPVQWTEQCQVAFERLGEPLLFTPNFKLPFVLLTDVLNGGLGAILSQEVDGLNRLVLYLRRKLVEWEERYSTVEKECLAIKWAVDALRYYLLGHAFTLCSDHASFRWLKDTNPRITGGIWHYSHKLLIHRPRVQMVIADFLSRLPKLGRGVG